MSNAVGWFEIYVQDMKRAKAFYEGVLGASSSRCPARSSSTRCSRWSGRERAPPARSARWRGLPKKLGGKVERPKESIGEYGFISLVHDTEGNMIGLHSRK